MVHAATAFFRETASDQSVYSMPWSSGGESRPAVSPMDVRLSHAAPRCDVPGAADSNMGMGIDVDAGEDAQQLALVSQPPVERMYFTIVHKFPSRKKVLHRTPAAGRKLQAGEMAIAVLRCVQGLSGGPGVECVDIDAGTQELQCASTLSYLGSDID
eukprot:3592212-Alexandrium_andersonii.AAC.1